MHEVNKIYEEANLSYNEGEYEKALDLYKSIVEAYPETTEAFYARVNISKIQEKDSKQLSEKDLVFDKFKNNNLLIFLIVITCLSYLLTLLTFGYAPGYAIISIFQQFFGKLHLLPKLKVSGEEVWGLYLFASMVAPPSLLLSYFTIQCLPEKKVTRILSFVFILLGYNFLITYVILTSSLNS